MPTCGLSTSDCAGGCRRLQFDDLEATVSHTCRGVRGVPNGSNATIGTIGSAQAIFEIGNSRSRQFRKSPNARSATAADCADLMAAADLMANTTFRQPSQARARPP